jgi:hypothetical protein
MPHGFDAYRIFISAPGDLAADRDACHEAIARANETTAMPAKILLVEVGLREDEQIAGFQSIVADNVRWSSFFIQIFRDHWGPHDLFRTLFLLAGECRRDAAQPMRDGVVFLRDAPRESSAETLAFHRELEEQTFFRVHRYSRPGDLGAYLEPLCEEWARSLVVSGAGSAPPQAVQAHDEISREEGAG